MMLVLGLVALFLGVQLLVLLGNLFFFPVLQQPSDDFIRPQESVSILIPARNEALNLPETLPRVLRQTGVAEVIVLNDQSDDETAQILTEFQNQYSHLRVLEGKPLAEGWTGKNWACQQLAEAASGDLLIFTDADVRWEKASLSSLLELKTLYQAEFVSVWPRQVTVSVLETIAVPLIDQILLGALPYLGVRYLKPKSLAAGNGQLMLWTRAAYQKLGGHAAFKKEILEDVRMAQAAKAKAIALALALGKDLLSTRMYHTDAALVEGFSKNIVIASGGKLALFLLALANTLAHTLCWFFIPFQPLWLGIGLMSLSLRALCNLKTGRDWRDCFWQPFMSLVLWRVVWRALRQQKLAWKGRIYP